MRSVLRYYARLILFAVVAAAVVYGGCCRSLSFVLILFAFMFLLFLVSFIFFWGGVGVVSFLLF